MKALDADVIVVGGGPAGTSSAWHLAQLGADVLLIERAEFPRAKVCGEYLSPQASRILDAMGASDALSQSSGSTLGGMRVRAPNGLVIEGRFAASHRFAPFRDRGISIRRTELDAILLQRAVAAGVRHITGHVTSCDVSESGIRPSVDVRMSDGSSKTLHAGLIVGADGLRSSIARSARLTRHARTPRRLALMAHWEGVNGIEDFGEMHVARDGYVGINYVGNDVTNVAVVVPADAIRKSGSDAGDFYEHFLKSQPHLASRFSGAKRVERVRGAGPFSSFGRRASRGRAVLVGDAADFFDPFTGEGIYSALRGGEILAPLALEASRASGSTAHRALREYDRMRRREFAGKWIVERIIGGFIGWAPAINHAARALTRRREMADLLVGVTGNFIPAREVLHPRYLAQLLVFGA